MCIRDRAEHDNIEIFEPIYQEFQHYKMCIRDRLETVLLVELVDCPVGLGELLLPSVERVGVGRNFNPDKRVFVTIFPFNGFLGSSR